ncbi:MAG: adenylate cyclase [Phycisphaerales bacterium]|nr:MAG: adenylate cyclase [Phycisphaerales bacterium]
MLQKVAAIMTSPARSVEIERTFLLQRKPELPQHAVQYRFEQGYLPAVEGDDPKQVEGRIRRATRPDGSVTCTHTIKRGLGLVREESEREISADEFDRLWPQTDGRRILKSRYAIEEGGLTWEVDVFEQPPGLVLAEVELPSAEHEVPIPAWLAGHIEREVTEEPEFSNYELALRSGRLNESS